MALDATPGGATANSYVTLAEAEAYLENHLYATAWQALTDTQKEQTLVMATRVLNLQCYVGTSTSAVQSLRFPMVGLVSPRGYDVDTSVVPQEIKDATIELARLLATTDFTAPLDAEVQGLSELQAGPIKLKFADMVTSKALPTTVKSMLPPTWLCPTDEQVLSSRRLTAEFRVL